MKTKRTDCQQGDVILTPIKKLPDGLKKLDHNLLALGEATGHFHALNKLSMCQAVEQQAAPNVTLYTDENGQMFAEIVEPSRTNHQQHPSFEVDPGTYQIDIIKEYDYDSQEVRNVVD